MIKINNYKFKIFYIKLNKKYFVSIKYIGISK